jgi:type IV pilus assembly protein PilP
MRSARSMLAAVAAGLLFVACSDDPPAAAPAPAAKPAAAKTPEPAAAADAADGGTAVPAPPPVPVYAYNPLGKRDPFRTPAQEEGPKAQGDNTCSEILCQWDLDQLSLVAVVTGEANPFAMVEDPQGRGHIVRRGQRIGKQGGKVSQILRDSLTVTEYWQAPDGKTNANNVSLKLKADKESSPEMDLLQGGGEVR